MSDFIDGMEAHIEGLRRYARALVVNPADADDLVQESLRRVLSYADENMVIDNWRAYLYTTMHNVRAGQYARSGARHQVSLDDCAEQISCPATQHVHLECRDLERELARLPVDQREVLLLVGLEELSYREVADVLGIPLGTVMSRLSRARAALRRAMEGFPAADEAACSEADIA
jgi:RNA polymerase sigma-70 factor (ECF subfamily)